MRTERGLDRLVFFTDAVTAIAITLLILPLVDTVASEASKTSDIQEFLSRNLPQMGTFVLSFAVIARLWVAHHGLFEHVRSYTRQLIWVDLLWAFTIVLLPLPTALISQFATSRVTVALYIGTMTVSSAALSIMMVMVRRNAELHSESNPLTYRMVFGTVANTVEFAIALVIGVVFPSINFFALLLLVVCAPIEHYFERRHSARIGSDI
jgi:uncharacterized membrane protein